MPCDQPKTHTLALQHNPTEQKTHTSNTSLTFLDSKCSRQRSSQIASPHHLKLCLYPLPLPLLLLLLLLLLNSPPNSDMGVKSRVLIIGATGYIGKHVARASVAEGHPTSILIRPSTLTTKAELVTSFKDLGITLVEVIYITLKKTKKHPSTLHNHSPNPPSRMFFVTTFAFRWFHRVRVRVCVCVCAISLNFLDSIFIRVLRGNSLDLQKPQSLELSP